ncbi:uncharacterized protein PHALS_15097 [Plasmopara halstedii]|uniref:Uncharacterized protein n=1 Tax=Plasmopara halstedii TaxID=4781 RepID=A0A0P1B019_PLAHL|nr:uncharacterized protein PHALS_15097 [Plasmopara halstedii]CEG48034.1 hypothetical protein PHALS_15097 [Plasmopara halstedii]|eukprot:XP_024584403.1 hypothetical protein PHALS_15097 [Plasmopara halstedii]
MRDFPGKSSSIDVMDLPTVLKFTRDPIGTEASGPLCTRGTFRRPWTKLTGWLTAIVTFGPGSLSGQTALIRMSRPFSLDQQLASATKSRNTYH